MIFLIHDSINDYWISVIVIAAITTTITDSFLLA